MNQNTEPENNLSNVPGSSNYQSIDAAERQRAVDTAGSFIVQAPAGSGKTSLLTQRFLALLGEVEKPEDILAITFTNKAVGEMRERIFSFLNQVDKNSEPENGFQKLSYAAAKKALARSNARGWDLLNNPSRLNIRTIDSFCSYIAQNLPISSGMGYVLETEADCGKYYMQAAVNAVNQMLYGEAPFNLSAELQIILAELDNNQKKLEELLAEMLANRSDLLGILEEIAKDENQDYECLYNNQFVELRARSERNYRRWCLSIGAELEQIVHSIDSDFYEVVLEAARACCEHNGGIEAITNKGVPNKLVSAFIRLAADGESLALWEKWRCLATILLNNDHNGFRKEINSKSLKVMASENDPVLLSGIISKDKKKPYYDSWTRFAGKDGLLTDCANCLKQDEFIDTLKLAAHFGDNYTEEEWAQIVRRLHVFAFAVKHLQDIFAQEMKCDYSEISRAALKASDPYGPEGLDRFSISSPIKHILVDEYQDTSWEQYKLLIHLTSACDENGNSIFSAQPGEKRAEGTIFCVGDPMQSIYRFRGADVSVYTYTSRVGLVSPGTDHIRLAQCHLQQNFRSDKQLIDNLCLQVFAKIFPKQTSSSKGIVSFKPSTAVKQNSDNLNTLIVRPVIGSEYFKSLAESQLYRKIFANISELNRSFEINQYQDSLYEAKLVAADIKRIRQIEKEVVCAVLLETKNLGDELLRELQAENIPVIQKEIQKLSQTEPVPLLVAITKVFIDPLDRTSWITILRSPLVGLTWEEVCLVMERYLINKNGQSSWSRPREFWQALGSFLKENRLSSQNAELYKRCLNLRLIFSQAFLNRRGLSLVRSIEGLWRSLGGPAFCNEAELEAAQQYINFLTRYDSGALWPTADTLDTDLNDLFADTLISEGNPVQFMTIHSSKGLEFDYVFLPGLGRKSAKPGSTSLLNRAAIVYDNDQIEGSDVISVLDSEGSTSGMSEAGAEYNGRRGINDDIMIAAGQDMPIGEAVSCIKRKFDTAERVRLFYVAATRAKKRLFIYTYMKLGSGNSSGNSLYCGLEPKQQGKVLTKELLYQLAQYFVLGQNLNDLHSWPVMSQFLVPSKSCIINDESNKYCLSPNFVESYCQNVISICDENSSSDEDGSLLRLKLNWAADCGLQEGLNSCRESSNNTEEEACRQISKQAGSSYGSIDNVFKIRLGTIIHYAFEQLVGSRLVQDLNQSCESGAVESIIRTLEPILGRSCAQDLTQEQTKRALETAGIAVKNLLFSEKGRWILKRRDIDGCELSFYADSKLLCTESEKTDADNNYLTAEKRIIDRYFVEDETLWIIDYKTSVQRKHETLAEFYRRKCRDYKDQLTVYKRIAAQIYPEYHDKIKAALYFPLVEQGEGFCEIQFDSAESFS
ncbi:MAG: UvrD-helicase domain-containing protein [Candidatus Bruticola sp.]